MELMDYLDLRGTTELMVQRARKVQSGFRELMESMERTAQLEQRVPRD
jgi:hypothetical protein